MNKYRLFLVFLSLVIVLAIGFYLYEQSKSPLEDGIFITDEPAPPVRETPSPEPESSVEYPVPKVTRITEPLEEKDEPASEETPLPELDKSDETMQKELENLYSKETIAELFLVKTLIRHFVVTVDNMTRRKLPQRYVFTTPPPGQFIVDEPVEDEYYLSEENYNRYNKFVRFITDVNLERLIDLYRYYYPLFQEAYEDLGYPNQYFNDRLVQVIEHLLKTPTPTDKIRLVRPNVFYKFADPDLESLSAGQKILIRMGPENATKVKSVLREAHRRLTST